MRALVDFVLDERSTTPWIDALSVTSDGYVVLQPADENGLLHDELLGSADDLYRNYAGVLQAAGATGAEARQFYDHYVKRAIDPNPVLFAAHIVNLLTDGEFVDVPNRDATRRRARHRATVPHGRCEGVTTCVEHAHNSTIEPCK